MQAIKSPITDYELFKSKTVSGSFISFEAYELQIELNANGIVNIILTKKEGRSWTKTKSNNTKSTPTVFKSTYFQGQSLQFVLIKRQRYSLYISDQETEKKSKTTDQINR